VLTRRRLIALSTGSAVALSLSGRAAWVQMQSLDWPNRVVRFIVPFAAGGPTDIVARVVTEQLSKIWGQQVVIENRGGAGTNIGNELVARSDPDGYTVLFATASLAVNRSLYRSLSYDPIADFAAVSLVSKFSLFMFVPNSLPTKSVMEFVAYAKAYPGKLTLASPGTGSTPHLAGDMCPIVARRPPSTTSSPAAWTVISAAARCSKTCGRASCVDLRLPAPKEIQWRRKCPRWPRPAFRVMRCRRGTACSCRPGRRLKSSGK
jgi:Tripartite tricarboxylate transporter family receptor